MDIKTIGKEESLDPSDPVKKVHDFYGIVVVDIEVELTGTYDKVKMGNLRAFFLAQIFEKFHKSFVYKVFPGALILETRGKDSVQSGSIAIHS